MSDYQLCHIKRFMPEPLRPEALLHLGLPGNMSLQDFEKMVYVLKGEI